MAGTERSHPSPISIGNCKVEIEANDFACKSGERSLLISVSDDVKIKITVDDSRMSYSSTRSTLKPQDIGGGCFALEDFLFTLLNPKDVDSRSKLLLQEALKLYMEELPTMNYAANTGKKSQFLEKCVSSGKYRTLILRSNSCNGIEEVIAAVSYQIVPTDTQYAEIPLAAVCSKYQKKGIGQLLYRELRERLQNVGIFTIFCWADKVSEGFWLKQGFASVGEVNNKGKVRRLPIKAAIRRALSYPGGSTLMVAHLKKDAITSINSSQHVALCSSKFNAKPLSNAPSTIPGLIATMASDTPKNHSQNDLMNVPPNNSQSRRSMKIGCSMDTQNGEGNGYYVASKRCTCSGEQVKRGIWEASLSSLKSKRVKVGHLSDCCQDLACDNCSFGTSEGKQSLEGMPETFTKSCSFEAHVDGKKTADINHDLFPKGNSPRIMFMNIADDAKKTWLTKIVEELGGCVTSEGSTCTHIITGKVRRTMNFCIALCSGAWVVSPNWLKESFREGRFLGESQFILEDEEYLLKYKSELRDAVMRAKANPNSLLKGYNISLAKHIQPSVDILSSIVKSAGGNVTRGLGRIEEPSKTIFVACEEDMAEALAAARKKVWSFSSDWLMNCVMKQELDLEAPQFAESL